MIGPFKKKKGKNISEVENDRPLKLECRGNLTKIQPFPMRKNYWSSAFHSYVIPDIAHPLICITS